MERTQVIRISASATRYEGWCERCLDQSEPQSIGVQWLRVEGELPLAADGAWRAAAAAIASPSAATAG